MNFLDGARQTLQFFTLREWKFNRTNFESISGQLSDVDKHLFSVDFESGADIDRLVEQTRQGWRCLRKYKLKEDISEEAVEKARKRMKM